LDLKYDLFAEPIYETNGVLFTNRKGLWGVECVEEKDIKKKALDVCSILGSSLSMSDAFEVGNSSNLLWKIGEDVGKCVGVNVSCEGVTSAPFGEPSPVQKSWEVLVKIDGKTYCTAVLLNRSWIMSSINCQLTNM